MGYDSVWCSDHILIGSRSGTPYERITESVTSLSFVAASTTKVKLGISALIIAMRDPVTVAKQLATVDYLSGGRLAVAVGTGWAEREFRNVGADFHQRGRVVDESIRLLRSMWNGKPDFKGKRTGVDIKDAVLEPRPVQQRLPIWVAGNSEFAMRRAARLGDAWHPNVFEPGAFGASVKRFRAIPGGEKKDICVRIAVDTGSGASTYVSPQGEKRLILSGDFEKTRTTLDGLERMGVSCAVLAPNHDGRSSVEGQLLTIRDFAKEFVRR
ncbi:MAG: TIGR03619 family F420-dependent LLM class oxidoreductase [Nitrososphaerota archaeon]|nr:TIGR03619 family F420-dependent LLM class oxidoreductase [Nitrososphaerota archaeon]